MSRERVPYFVDNLVVEPVEKPKRLRIRAAPNSSIDISWPLGSAGIQLFGREALDDLTPWVIETAAVIPHNGEVYVVLPAPAGNRYFKLGER